MVPPPSGRGGSPIPTVGFKADLGGVHVYVVDDNEDARQLLSEVLEYCGALVHLSTNAEDALRDLAQFLPTVVICDLALPGVDGFTFIRMLRKLPKKRGGLLPAIAISAHYEDFSRPEALRLGFNEYLQKPLDLHQLCATLTRLIRTNELTATETLG